jgi:hypothetical protein
VVKIGECLLPCSSESFVYPSAKNVKIHVCKPIVLPVVFYGFEIWSLDNGEQRLRVFENRVIMRILIGSKGGKLQEDGLYYVMRSSMLYFM